MRSKRITLGIESALAGGSLSLMLGDQTTSAWIGDDPVARAELLLPKIDELLSRNGLSVRDIERVIVSTGPGSYTGIRVGIATALGICAARSIDCCGLTALDAIAASHPVDGEATVAVPMGRMMVCIQAFAAKTPTAPPAVLTSADFLTMVANGSGVYIVHGEIARHLSEPNIIDAGFQIAEKLCFAIDAANCNSELEPLFVQSANSPR